MTVTSNYAAIDNPDEPVTLTRGQLFDLAIAAERGQALAGWIAATSLVGHSRPGNTLDYMPAAEPGSGDAFVRDFVAWTSGRFDYAPGCEDRLREYGMQEAANRAGRVAEELGLADGLRRA